MNNDITSILMSADGIDRWETTSLNFSLPSTSNFSDLDAIAFEVSEFDLGESVTETPDPIFLALDDVNLTFCLPCDFDSLSAPGNLMLNDPPDFNITLGTTMLIELEASAVVCSNMSLVFGIESGIIMHSCQ